MRLFVLQLVVEPVRKGDIEFSLLLKVIEVDYASCISKNRRHDFAGWKTELGFQGVVINQCFAHGYETAHDAKHPICLNIAIFRWYNVKFRPSMLGWPWASLRKPNTWENPMEKVNSVYSEDRGSQFGSPELEMTWPRNDSGNTSLFYGRYCKWHRPTETTSLPIEAQKTVTYHIAYTLHFQFEENFFRL